MVKWGLDFLVAITKAYKLPQLVIIPTQNCQHEFYCFLCSTGFVNDVKECGLADKILAFCILRINITKVLNNTNAGGILCLFIHSRKHFLLTQLHWLGKQPAQPQSFPPLLLGNNFGQLHRDSAQAITH
jgi:hypothetical protein